MGRKKVPLPDLNDPDWMPLDRVSEVLGVRKRTAVAMAQRGDLDGVKVTAVGTSRPPGSWWFKRPSVLARRDFLKRERRRRGNPTWYPTGRPKGSRRATWPTVEELDALGDQISPMRRARLLAHHTLAACAERVGGGVQQLSDIELGRRPLSDAMAERVAGLYGLDFGTLKLWHLHALRERGRYPSQKVKHNG